MKNVLVAARNTDACNILSSFIDKDRYEVTTATDGMTIRGIDISRYDVIFISVPLSNESGIELITELRNRTSAHLIALVKEESADKIYRKISPVGAFIVTKPLYKGSLMQAINFCEMHAENETAFRNKIAELEKKSEEQKLISRAKLILIEKRGFSEYDAHRYIQQEAMNARKSQTEIAEEIIGSVIKQDGEKRCDKIETV